LRPACFWQTRRAVSRFGWLDKTLPPTLLDEFIAPDFVDEPDTPKETRGLESLKQRYTQFYKGFPDFHGSIEDIIAEGDKVWIRFKGTGTHKGEYSVPHPSSGKMITLAPTGKKLTMTAVTIYRIVDTKVVTMRTFLDMLDFYKDLGVIEYTEKGKKLFPDDVK
jgi:predicted ester cyclase